MLKLAQAAEEHYLESLTLCPITAIADFGSIYYQLGCLYADIGQIQPAQQQYELAIQYFEQTGDRYRAGSTRYNISRLCIACCRREPARRRDLLRRAQAYAQASLRDFQQYGGRCRGYGS